jgi:uncharacterized protein YneF (UPF0154 family)
MSIGSDKKSRVLIKNPGLNQNVVTSVWYVQMGSKLDQKLINDYNSFLYKKIPYPVSGLCAVVF